MPNTHESAALAAADEALFTEKRRQADAARNRLIADVAGVPYDVAAKLGYPCEVSDDE